MIYKSYILENDDNLLFKSRSILFYGENLGLKNYFKKKIKDLGKNFLKINLTNEEIIRNANLLIKEINNASLFEDKKIIFIEDVSDKIIDILQSSLESIDDNKLVCFASVLDKKSKIRNFFEKAKEFGAVPCYEDNFISIRNLIQKELKDFKNLTPQNLNLIIENCNLERSKLYNELEKIKLFFLNKELDTNKLEQLLDVRLNENFNNLKDEVFKGNKLNTNKLLNDTLIEQEKINYYLNLINQRLYKLNEVQIMMKNAGLEKSINSLKPPIFWKDKENFTVQARKWSQKKIKYILDKSYNLEINIKSNSIINKNILFKKLLVDICHMANS